MIRFLTGVVVAGLLAAPAWSSETVTYTYDAHGRLTQADTSGGPNDGVSVKHTYDAGHNRTKKEVTGA